MLLETVVKNCGDMVHMHVAEKDLPHEMVKMVKKKPDFHVKEKILILIDTWQEAFGGPRGRYPQYYVAYQDLLRLGAVFPQRSERSAPVFTPPQTQPLTSYPPNIGNPVPRSDGAESSAEAEFPTLSLMELQNARGIMDVLSEMLSALDPGNKEGIKQEVIVDLVEQCRTYKQRVVHLVNSTSDESLLCQGLALNDDLQRVLAKHEALASGVVPVQSEKLNPEPPKALVPVDSPLIYTGDTKQLDRGSTSSTSVGTTPLSIPPPTTNGQLSTPVKADPKIDLLSGDDLNALALVPVGQPQPTSPAASQHNALALVDMFLDGNSNQQPTPVGHVYPSPSQFQQPQDSHAPQPSAYPNGTWNGQVTQQQQPSSPVYGQMTQQQQPPSPVYGAQVNDSFPPPPWEAQLDNSLPAVNRPQEMQATQGVVYHAQPSPSGSYVTGPQPMAHDQAALGVYNGGQFTPMQSNQMQGLHPYPLQNPQQQAVMYPQQMQANPQMGYMYLPQQMYNNQMPAGYGYGYSYGQGQGQGQNQMQNAYFAQQTISAMSVRDDSGLGNPASNILPSGRPARAEDKLFGDLVDISKFKPGKTTPGRAGSM
ncbi:TOM1-like protein 9 isoform X2 [Salvia splendens]|uniref:TOM1-like protein 9 isoform X2 n=1 Tax=Salvia splendens TaxID=180675 RepID=UPI001C26A024|nr:TOM1-like protein 9 isoform X2 [Salvia splendens]